MARIPYATDTALAVAVARALRLDPAVGVIEVASHAGWTYLRPTLVHPEELRLIADAARDAGFAPAPGRRSVWRRAETDATRAVQARIDRHEDRIDRRLEAFDAELAPERAALLAELGVSPSSEATAGE